MRGGFVLARRWAEHEAISFCGLHAGKRLKKEIAWPCSPHVGSGLSMTFLSISAELASFFFLLVLLSNAPACGGDHLVKVDTIKAYFICVTEYIQTNPQGIVLGKCQLMFSLQNNGLLPYRTDGRNMLATNSFFELATHVTPMLFSFRRIVPSFIPTICGVPEAKATW